MTFWGFEWTSTLRGHITIINSDDFCISTYEPTRTLNQLVTWLDARDVVAFFNHPGRYDTTFDGFNFNYTDKIVGMELWNKSTDYYSNNGYYSDDGGLPYYDEALVRGWYIGASGSQDNHNANWGTMNEWRMAILAPEKTRASLFDAMKARRFYSTRDKNLVLSFTCNGAQMGSQIDGGSLNVAIDASDGDSEIFSKIDLLKNGTVIETWTPGTTNPSVTTTTGGTLGDYFYVRVYQGGGWWQAISSPIFIISSDPDVTPPSLDPMTWAALPYATSESSISMTATTATDSENGVEYYFTCTAGGGNDSGWQTSTSYEDTGLVPKTQYTYTVTASDTSGNYNETAASTAESARTDRDIYPPTPDPMTWASVPTPTPGSGGDLLVYEPFDYATGPIDGVTVGAQTGLTGTWNANYADTTCQIKAGSLTYSTLPTAGNRWGPGAVWSDPYIEATLDPAAFSGKLDNGDVLWFSFVGALNLPGSTLMNQHRLQIGADASNNVGIYTNKIADGLGEVRAAITIHGKEMVSTGSVTFTENRLFVGRVIFGATDTVEVYLPGPDLVKPENPAGTVQGASS